MSAEQVTFDRSRCTIAGTFLQLAKPIAAALLITGSGKVNRDSDAQLPGGVKFRAGITRAIADALERITVPVLAITGGPDLQVPPGDIDTMGTLVPGPFDGQVVGDLSDVLRHDPTSTGPRGYRRAVRQAVSSEVLQFIIEWVASQWRRP